MTGVTHLPVPPLHAPDHLSSPRTLSAHNRKGAEPSAWPTLRPEALCGLAGEVVRVLEPNTEADPAGLLVDFLVSFGCAVGTNPYAIADAAVHHPRLNAVFVGETAKARKGTTRANIRQLFDLADPIWSATRVMGGLASGEGLIAAVADRDPDAKPEEKQGTDDKRLLVVEPEFARLLAVGRRDGSTLSAIQRDAWDTGRLRVMTRREPLVASGAHICLIGHITTEELVRALPDIETANGSANRNLFVCVRRSKLLPSGGNLHEETRRDLARRIGDALSRARGIGLVHRSHEAEAIWGQLYEDMAEADVGGLVGAVTARAEAQVLRLSLVYAILDGSRLIEAEHLWAAYAVWQYAEASAARIFGESLGDEVADRLLTALRVASAEGLDGTEQRNLFGRHVSGKRLDFARQLLEGRGLARTEQVQTGGRPRTVTFAVEDALKATKATKGTR